MNFKKLNYNSMKKILLAIVILVFTAGVSNAQLIDDPKKDLNQSTNNLILGIFNPNNFSMNHSFEVSYLSSSYGSASVTSYVNSMNYKFNDKFSVSADIRLQYSPFASSVHGANFSEQLQKDLSGISLSRLSVNYKLSENSFIKLEYRNVKNSLYNNGFYDQDYYGY